MKRAGYLREIAGLFLLMALAGVETAHAQSQDRERAQLLQMQQQLQRLQADNAQLQREKVQQQEQSGKDAERVKKESEQTTKELRQARAQVAANERDLSALRAELDSVRSQNATQIEEWKKALAERDSALQLAAVQRKRLEDTVELVQGRLKVQTSRADTCETKHNQAMQFGTEVVDRYQNSRLRLCEPVTGIWQIRQQDEIQALRERLYELRLDFPLAPTAAQTTAPAQAQSPAPAQPADPPGASTSK